MVIDTILTIYLHIVHKIVYFTYLTFPLKLGLNLTNLTYNTLFLKA